MHSNEIITNETITTGVSLSQHYASHRLSFSIA